MYQKRVLVVEDLPDVRVTVAGLLLDEGYYVHSAANREEALKIIGDERFHVALLDVRLDESDEDNQDGLSLMHEIKAKYPNIAIIITTGYATVQIVQEARQPNQQGISPAFDFLDKQHLGQAPEYVKRAFASVLKINEALQIDYPPQFLAQLPSQLRFPTVAKPPAKQLIEEADEILRKLFFTCEKIQVEPIKRGYSGTAVLKITPWYPGQRQGEVQIAKIGQYALVEKEIQTYKRMVQGQIGGHRIPNTLEEARTRSLAGILYTFAGLGQSTDFATFYQTADISEILPVIKNLFQNTCFPWRHESGTIVYNADLREAYTKHLRLKSKELQLCLDNTMGGRHPFQKDGEGNIWIEDKVLLTNPVTFALSTDLRTDYYISVIHGDLHGYNVLVDEHNQTWLIDFAHTCDGPLLQDYVCFETFLRLPQDTLNDWNLIYIWEQALAKGPDLCHIDLPAEFDDNPKIQKAHQAILAARQLAFENHPNTSERAYLIGLLFNALKITTIMNLPRAQRDHALISAALIAERLQKDAKKE